ncbi:MAG: PhoH family protein, partial [Ilumatobacteraceae bacterium]
MSNTFSSARSVDVVVPGAHLMAELLGQRDKNLRMVEQAFPATDMSVRGNVIHLEGGSTEIVGKLFEELVRLLQRGETLDELVVGRSIDMVRSDQSPSVVLSDEIVRVAKGRTVKPKTAGQKRYVDAIRENVITFGIGPAGTGKSWLAVAMAVQALQAKQV